MNRSPAVRLTFYVAVAAMVISVYVGIAYVLPFIEHLLNALQKSGGNLG